MTTRLFVYGTLAPGCDAWSVLAPWATGTPSEDAVVGVLYDTGRGYPAAVFGREASPGAGRVHGHVVDLDRARTVEALAAIDRYEGYEYERIRLHTVSGVEVVTYSWIAPLVGCRPVTDGRWDRA